MPEGDEKPAPVERIDEEFAEQTTISDDAKGGDAHPELNPQSPAELGDKIRKEADAGEGAGDKAKQVLKEIDRDLSGEYEARQDPDAPSHER